MQGIVDIGNTAIKLALFEKSNLIKTDVVTGFYEGLDSYFSNCKSVFVGSTADQNKTDKVKVALKKMKVISSVVKEKLNLSFNNYSFSSLGLDRIANAVEANAFFPNEPVLVIDMGTCITYDAVVDGQFLSQGISPGLQMRLKSMHHFTGRLPELDFNEEIFPEIFGDMKNTESSMKQSVLQGMLAEMNDRIINFAKQFSDSKVVLTGGDVERLKKHIKISTFADPYWTLKGYNEILLQHI